MATKVKGDKIQEGSIPLSALSDSLQAQIKTQYGLQGYVGELSSSNTKIENSSSVLYIYNRGKIYDTLTNNAIYFNDGPQVTITITSYGFKTVLEITKGESDVSYYGKIFVFNSFNELPQETPNWNAQEGESGYIENRTHYTTQIPLSTTNYTFIEDFPKYYDNDTERYYSKQDVDILYTEDEADYLLTIPANTLLGYEYSSQRVNIEINAGGEIFQFESYTDTGDIFIKITKPNYGDNFRVVLYTQLDEKYIPDTIARKSELTELSAEVGKKVDADFVNNAIAEAIGEAIDGGY